MVSGAVIVILLVLLYVQHERADRYKRMYEEIAWWVRHGIDR